MSSTERELAPCARRYHGAVDTEARSIDSRPVDGFARRLLALTAMAALAAAVAGLMMRYQLHEVVSEEDAHLSMTEAVARWEARGFIVDPAQANLRVEDEEPLNASIAGPGCSVVVLGRWGRVHPERAVRSARGCTLRPSGFSRAATRPYPLDAGVWPVFDPAPMGMRAIVLRAPFSVENNPFTVSGEIGGGAEVKAAYVSYRLDSIAEGRRALLGPQELPTSHIAIAPGSAAGFRAALMARGLYPGVSDVPETAGLEASPGALAEGTQVFEAAPPGLPSLPSSGAPFVPDRGRVIRALAIVDPVAFASPCVEVHLMPHHGHADGPVATARRSTTGLEARLDVEPDRTRRDHICDAEGPVLYTTELDDRSSWGLLVLEAPLQPPANSTGPVALASSLEEQTPSSRCRVAPDGEGCEEIIRDILRGRTEPLAPMLAERLARARCDRAVPRSCVLWVEAALATAGAVDLTDPLALLDAACEEGDARALGLRGDMRRNGHGAAESDEAALVDYDAACAGGVDIACTNARLLAAELRARP